MKKTTSASVIRYIDETTAQVTKAFEKKRAEAEASVIPEVKITSEVKLR